MDTKYKDIHILNKDGDEIFTQRQVKNVCIKNNFIVYTTERNRSLLLGEVGTTIHELLIIDTKGVKVVID